MSTDLDARVRSLELTSNDEQELIGLPHAAAVQEFEVVREGPAPPPAAFLSSLRLLPNVRLQVSADTRGCLRLVGLRERGERRAAAMVLLTGGPEGSEGFSLPSEIALSAGEAVRFCTSDRAFQLLVSPTRLALSRIRSEAAPSGLRLPTILSGTLRRNQTGEVGQLRPFDLIHLDGIRKGTLMLAPTDGDLQVVFSGTVSHARSLYSDGSGKRDLRPSLVDFLVRNPVTRSLFGIITGLVGMLWAGWRYLFGSRRD